MLVLSRKRNESLVFRTSDGELKVTITDIRGDQVRVGITAPASVRVWRDELLDADGRPRPKAA